MLVRIGPLCRLIIAPPFLGNYGSDNYSDAGGSFWGRLKTASVHGHKFATREQARQTVMDWMAFYNHRRLHSSLGYLSPMQFEQRWFEAQPKKAAQSSG